MDKSLLSDDRLACIRRMTSQVRNILGSTAELGVYMGGVSRMIAEALPHKRHYCFDTFAGITNVSESDVLENGNFNDLNVEETLAYLSACSNIIIKQGYFPDTTVDISDAFCLVHIDGDTYQTTKDALEWFYPRMSPGGVMIFDDWLWPYCPGVEKSLKEFLVDKLEQIVETTQYQCVIIKQVNT